MISTYVIKSPCLVLIKRTSSLLCLLSNHTLVGFNQVSSAPPSLCCSQSTPIQPSFIAQIFVTANHLCSSFCTFFSCSLSCFRFKFHTWMQFSDHCYEQLWHCIVVFAVHLIIPKVEFALFHASAHCLKVQHPFA